MSELSEIGEFLDTLFLDETGYCYVPTKSEQGHWQPYHFKWPEQRDSVITHLATQARLNDCYVAPSLFKAPSDKKPAWKGSNFVWVEFDGNAPKELPNGIPKPSIRVQSSVAKHEHWYWRLKEFETDYRALEGLAKSLTYTLDADKSGWDCSQVLRPPGTIHQESKRRVKLLSSGNSVFSYGDFTNLVEAPEPAVVNTTFATLPDHQDIVAKYRWPIEATELFKKDTQPVGSRSSALTALGFFCIEMGMTNEESYSILLNADDRWGKYKHRSPADRAKRLTGIINHCRSKKEVDAELRLSERESFVSLGDFRQTDLRVKWVYKDFLTERGLGIISAAPGVGKTTLSIRLGAAVALGRDFLIWKFGLNAGQRVGFLSLEMAGLECKKFLDDMWPSFSSEQQETLEKDFYILPLGYSLPLGTREAQQMILDEINNHEIKFLVIDSLKAATGLDERKLDHFFEWINKHVRSELGVTVWIVHHNRKPPNEGPKKPRGLEDLYGDTFISAHPTTVISVWREQRDKLQILPLKIRLAAEVEPFRILRKPNLDFIVDKESVVDIHEPESESEPIQSDEPDLF